MLLDKIIILECPTQVEPKHKRTVEEVEKKQNIYVLQQEQEVQALQEQVAAQCVWGAER